MRAQLNVEAILDNVPEEEEFMDSSVMEAVYAIRKLTAAVRAAHYNQTIMLSEPNSVGQRYSDVYEIWFNADEFMSMEEREIVKPQSGYCYIEKDRFDYFLVVVNTKKKPEPDDYIGPSGIYLDDEYDKTLSAWNDSCMVVENSERCYSKELAFCVSLTGGYKGLPNGQAVSFLSTGKLTCKINEIK